MTENTFCVDIAFCRWYKSDLKFLTAWIRVTFDCYENKLMQGLTWVRTTCHILTLCADQFESSTSPRATPRHLNFWRLASSNSLSSGQKCRSNAPPISTVLPLLKDKFCLQSNTAFQREICRNDTFKLLVKTLLKELFTNKGEILFC